MAVILGVVLHRHDDPGAPARRPARGRGLGAGADRQHRVRALRRSSTPSRRSTALILILAANTSYADFPRLGSILARDRFLPHQFTFRGDRLAFSNGIIVLGARGGAAARRLRGGRRPADPAVRVRRVRLVHAVAERHGGALAAAARAGLAAQHRHQRRRRGRDGGRRAHRRRHEVHRGRVDQHAGDVRAGDSPSWRSTGTTRASSASSHVPQRRDRRDRHAAQAGGARARRRAQPRRRCSTVDYARAISPNVTALHVTDDLERGAGAAPRVGSRRCSTCRSSSSTRPTARSSRPCISYIDALDRTDPGQYVTVVLPEFRTAWPWQRWLHNQSARRLQERAAGPAEHRHRRGPVPPGGRRGDARLTPDAKRPGRQV